MSIRNVRIAAALALATVAGAWLPAGVDGGPGDLPPQEEAGAFVVVLGRDTLAVERYTRTADRLSGTVVSRSPRTAVRTYVAALRPDGSISRLEVTTTAPGGGQPPTVITTEFTADSAITTVQRGDSTRRVPLAATGFVVPLVSFSHAIYEQALMRARAAGADSVVGTLVPPGNTTTYPVTLRLGADSGQISNLAGLQRVAVDARGRLLGLNGMESTQKFIVTRVPSVDVERMTAEFARRDAAGQGVGPLSPRDSAVADLGGAHLAVDYGRPFKRGRTIMGEVVPWGQVWRTGANAATGFTTTRDLEIGGVTVPAGSYTLWTLPSQEGWKLIVNRQTGQWGTEYSQEQDLARIDMQTRRLATPVEQFTIRLEPTGASAAVLRLAWDDTEAFVPIRVK
ncbi:MAG TPA: DUF2911 domain-containing protein [Longimicrobium sp.]|jgi:hypothetical protein